jgi:hypothetical protein
MYKMPIRIVKLELGDSEVIDLHCPACGTLVVPVGADPNPCEHVEFVAFPSGDIEYVRPDLVAIVDKWREEAEVEDEEFELAEVLSKRRKDKTSFVLAISWAGMPEMLWVGFRLCTPDSDDDSERDAPGDQEISKQQTPSKRASSALRKAQDNTKRNS